MGFSERELFARIIRCEAGGEGENGMKAVANVIMNRVREPSGEYARVGQGSLRNIINQAGQFDCMYSVLGGTAKSTDYMVKSSRGNTLSNCRLGLVRK